MLIGDRDVSGSSEGFDLAAENALEIAVIRDAGQDRGVGGEGDGGKRRAVGAKAIHELGREMLGVRGASPVSENEDLPSGRKGGNEHLARLEHGVRLRVEELPLETRAFFDEGEKCRPIHGGNYGTRAESSSIASPKL